MSMYKSLALAGSVAAALVAIAPAHANQNETVVSGSTDSGVITRSVRITTNDLNDRAALIRRIDYAAGEVCRLPSDGMHVTTGGLRNCFVSARSAAIEAVPSARQLAAMGGSTTLVLR
jgi:UrcA family protein